jgi:hypothetical protein
VYAQAYHLLTRTKFPYELTATEIEENEKMNKKYQVSSSERDLIQRFFVPATKESGQFMTATDIIEFLAKHTSLKISSVQVGKELKYLGFERSVMYLYGNNRYGYFLKTIPSKPS